MEAAEKKAAKPAKVKKTPAEKKAKVVKYPTKTTINLARDDEKNKKLVLAALSLVLVALLAGAVAKFGVIDQIARVNEAENQYDGVHAVYVATQEALDNYEEVQAEYRTYSMKWIYEDDSGRYVSVDRQQVLDLLESELMGWGVVKDFSVSGETMQVNMSGMNLSEISEMLIQLETYPIVAAVSLGTTTSEGGTGDLSFPLTIQLQPAAEEEEAAQ